MRGAVATFLTMAYILVANPQILSAAGVPKQPAVAGTAPRRQPDARPVRHASCVLR